MKEEIISFISQVFAKTGKKKAVIGVSGGIDSAVVLALVTNSLSKDSVIPVLMPFAKQEMQDAVKICTWNGFTPDLVIEKNIEPIVEAASLVLGGNQDQVRQGNLMARARMMVLFDTAKKHDALVAGTENKSENILGYFTRFGDSASDLEPIAHLYKTQVRQLAIELGLPSRFLEKQPSAGLWQGQSDEQEFGFSYQDADQLLMKMENEASKLGCSFKNAIEKHLEQNQMSETERKILQRVKQNWFKQEVPYKIN